MMIRLEQHYLNLFYDHESGYLVDCVWWKDNPVNRNLFPRLTSLLALYGRGELLLLDVLDDLAGFVGARMRHPQLGLQDVPVEHPDDPVYRRWDDHWLQNATRQTLKLARLSGDRELLEVQLKAFTRHFAADNLIHEDLYYAYPGGRYKPENLYQSTSWWQGMTAYAWWSGIIESVAGLRWDRGQLEYVPGDSGADVTLSNLHWGGNCWSVTVSGRGRWLDTLTVNGQDRLATCQLFPADDTVDQQVAIAKTDRVPEHPVILSAGACSVRVTQVSAGGLTAALNTHGFAQVWFFSPDKPAAVRVNGRDTAFRWVPARNEGVVAVDVSGEVTVEIDL